MAKKKLSYAQALQAMLYGDKIGVKDLSNYTIQRVRFKAA